MAATRRRDHVYPGTLGLGVGERAMQPAEFDADFTADFGADFGGDVHFEQPEPPPRRPAGTEER